MSARGGSLRSCGLWALGFGLWAGLGASPPAWTITRAQDLVVVAPNAAKVEYEDPRFRVVRLKMEANTTSTMHDRPRRVVIPLTENNVRMTRESGEVSNTRVPALNVAWSEPGKRSVTNLDTAFENFIVELKQAPERGVPISAPPDPRPPDYLSDPYHRWLLENQYVRVFEVRLPPGATTEFHRHALDGVSVRVSGGLVAVQRERQPWASPTEIPARSVAVDLDSRAPFVHRVRNDGKAEYHLILVQLK